MEHVQPSYEQIHLQELSRAFHTSGQSGVSAAAPIKPSFGVDEAGHATTGRWKTGAHQAVMTARTEMYHSLSLQPGVFGENLGACHWATLWP